MPSWCPARPALLVVAASCVLAGCGDLAACVISACTDAATRVAYDLERGARELRGSAAASLVVDHAPEPTPEGCAGGYTLQISEASALLVWCGDSIEGPATSSHITTYHLNYITVPQTFRIHKGAGEHALIELTPEDGEIVVTGLR
jgi:hypothetical protein